MERKKRIWFVTLVILFIALFAFIIRMQHNFENGSYASGQANVSELHTKVERVEEKEVKAEKEEANEDSSDEGDTELPSIMYVTAEQLNVRSGPGTDYTIAGIVYLHQEVEVSERVDDWVKITFNDVTGYVNIDYLVEELDE